MPPLPHLFHPGAATECGQNNEGGKSKLQRKTKVWLIYSCIWQPCHAPPNTEKEHQAARYRLKPKYIRQVARFCRQN